MERGGLSRPVTVTERNWVVAALVLIGSIVLFGGIYVAEMRSGRWNAPLRLVGQPAEAAMRFLGISHFLVALFYTFSSRSMRSYRSLAIFGAMLVLGGLLCGGFAWTRSFSPLLASGLFISYFLVHDFRDQVFFYFTNNDAPGAGDRQALGSVLFWTPFLAVSLLAVVGVGSMVLGVPGTEEAASSLGDLPPSWRWPAIAVPALLAVIAGLRIRQHAARAGIRSLAAHLRAHRPIHLVFAGSLSILLVSVALGWRGDAIVILHVTTWYVFSLRQISHRSGGAERPSGLLQRLRGTVAGFNALHIGSAAALLLAGLVWAYGFRSDPGVRLLSVLLEPAHFPFWTILHVTASFRPR